MRSASSKRNYHQHQNEQFSQGRRRARRWDSQPIPGVPVYEGPPEGTLFSPFLRLQSPLASARLLLEKTEPIQLTDNHCNWLHCVLSQTKLLVAGIMDELPMNLQYFQLAMFYRLVSETLIVCESLTGIAKHHRFASDRADTFLHIRESLQAICRTYGLIDSCWKREQPAALTLFESSPQEHQKGTVPAFADKPTHVRRKRALYV